MTEIKMEVSNNSLRFYNTVGRYISVCNVETLAQFLEHVSVDAFHIVRDIETSYYEAKFSHIKIMEIEEDAIRFCVDAGDEYVYKANSLKIYPVGTEVSKYTVALDCTDSNNRIILHCN